MSGEPVDGLTVLYSILIRGWKLISHICTSDPCDGAGEKMVVGLLAMSLPGALIGYEKLPS